MGKKKIAKRSKVKPFVKVCNFNHLMPTRYSIDVTMEKSVVSTNLPILGLSMVAVTMFDLNRYQLLPSSCQFHRRLTRTASVTPPSVRRPGKKLKTSWRSATRWERTNGSLPSFVSSFNDSQNKPVRLHSIICDYVNLSFSIMDLGHRSVLKLFSVNRVR